MADENGISGGPPKGSSQPRGPEGRPASRNRPGKRPAKSRPLVTHRSIPVNWYPLPPIRYLTPKRWKGSGAANGQISRQEEEVVDAGQVHRRDGDQRSVRTRDPGLRGHRDHREGPGRHAASAPTEFTDPATAAAAYPVVRSVTDGVLNSHDHGHLGDSEFVASDVGRPVTGTGIPDGTTIGTVTNGTTITLSAAATATATGVDPDFGALPHEATTTDLAAAIAIAFRRHPRPPGSGVSRSPPRTPDWDAALAAVAKLDVQIVVLANMPLNGSNAELIGKLANHVSTVSNTGGDGKERIGVAMLDPTLTAADAAALNTGEVKNERMFLLAHRSRRGRWRGHRRRHRRLRAAHLDAAQADQDQP